MTKPVIEEIDIKQINDNIFAPPKDLVFSYLYGRVVLGFLPLYQARVPLKMIRPFSDFAPHTTELGKKVFQHIITRYNDQRELPDDPWVYPDKNGFVLSDDYFTYYAVKTLKMDYLHCFIMGHPTFQGLLNVEGPAPLEFVQQLPGGANYTSQD